MRYGGEVDFRFFSFLLVFYFWFQDHHIYYNSSLLPGGGRDYWVDMESIPNHKVSEILSAAHRRALVRKEVFFILLFSTHK